MKPIRVLHVYKDYYPPVLGGIEKHLNTLARQQVEQGLDVTVLVTNPSPFPRSLCTRVSWEYKTPSCPGFHLIRAGRLFTVASTPISPAQALWQARLPADVVHLHFPYPPGEVANFLLGRGRVTVITYHSDVIRQRLILALYRPLLRRVLARADAIIATSPDYVRTSPFLAPITERVHVIPLGIDLTPFLQVDEEQARRLRKERLRGEDAFVLLFVGRLRYYKGVDVLLRAVARVSGVTLWVVGTGPMEREWRSLAQALGLGARVHFLGDIPEGDLPLYYAAADAFVLPSVSRAEALGLALIEAMAAGRPVVSTTLGTGTSFVNVHGETGWVVPPGDVDALAEAIRTLRSTPEMCARMGAAARERALKEFRADVMAERILDLYLSLLGRKR